MIPFLDLKKLNAPYQAAYQKVFSTFLDSGYYILGSQVKKFEAAFASYCGTDYCIGVGNGLDALRIILEGYKTLGRLKEADEVLVASNTYIASILAVQQAGLKAVLVESTPSSYNFNLEDLKAKITSKTKAVMPVHLYGEIAPMQAIKALADTHDLLVIEDAAQAHGAIDGDGLRAGGLADAAGFSFYPTKNLGALGDGGAITTSDAELAAICAQLRNYGTSSKYVNDHLGFNSRLDELQAALLSVKLPYLDSDNLKRQNIAQRYLAEITNDQLILPTYQGGSHHVFHLFVIRTPRREAFINHLRDHNVGTLIHYPIPPHQQKALSAYNHLRFPVSEKIHQEVVSIPLSPVMTEQEVSEVINAINSFS